MAVVVIGMTRDRVWLGAGGEQARVSPACSCSCDRKPSNCQTYRTCCMSSALGARTEGLENRVCFVDAPKTWYRRHQKGVSSVRPSHDVVEIPPCALTQQSRPQLSCGRERSWCWPASSPSRTHNGALFARTGRGRLPPFLLVGASIAGALGRSKRPSETGQPSAARRPAQDGLPPLVPLVLQPVSTDRPTEHASAPPARRRGRPADDSPSFLRPPPACPATLPRAHAHDQVHSLLAPRAEPCRWAGGYHAARMGRLPPRAARARRQQLRGLLGRALGARARRAALPLGALARSRARRGPRAAVVVSAHSTESAVRTDARAVPRDQSLSGPV